MRRVTILTLLLLGSSAAVWGANELSNRRAPGFALPDRFLKFHDLYDYRGKVVLVNIMKTDCPHCSAFSKVLSKAQAKFGNRLQVLSIVNSPPENQTTVRQYLEKNGLSMPILFDCRQVAMSYMKLTPQKPTFDVPHVFVIDKNGWIRQDYGYDLLNRGIFEGEGLFSVIEKYISEPLGRAAD